MFLKKNYNIYETVLAIPRICIRSQENARKPVAVVNHASKCIELNTFIRLCIVQNS